MTATKKTVKTKEVGTYQSGRGLRLADINEIIIECKIDSISACHESQRKILSAIECSFGEYYFDNKALAVKNRKLSLAVKQVVAINHFTKSLREQLTSLDSEVVDELYDPFRDRSDLLIVLLKLAGNFADPNQDSFEYLEKSSLMGSLMKSPGLTFREVLLPMLEALSKSAETFERVNIAKENRGKISRSPERNLIERLFSVYDQAQGHTMPSRNQVASDDFQMDDESDLTSFEYSEYKAVFVHRILKIANIPVSEVGIIGRDSKSPSQLVKWAKIHTRRYDEMLRLRLASFAQEELA